MKHSWFELITGFIALGCAIGFFVYTMRGAPDNSVGEQTFTAHFPSSRGIARGSEVRINGVAVGKVVKVHIDNQLFEAVVTLTISDNLRLPFDSSLLAQSPLLLGEPTLTLIPGKEKTYLQDGDRIVSTASDPSFEELLERALFVVGENAK